MIQRKLKMKKLIFFSLIIVILGVFYLYTEIYTRGVNNNSTQQQDSILEVEPNLAPMDQKEKDVLKKPTPAEVTNTSDSPKQEVADIESKVDSVTEIESADNDWRNDESPGKLPPQKDPFDDFSAAQQAKEHGTRIDDPETLDPDVLHSTEYNQLLEKFGDIPEVHTYMAYMRNGSKNVHLTIDEEIAGLEAMNHLFPSGSTRRTLVFFKWMKANGGYDAFEQGIPVEELQDLGITVEENETDDGWGYIISTK